MKKPENKNSLIYFKSIAGAATIDEETNKVHGYLAAMSVKDRQKEILMPGCCNKSIKERGPSSNTARKIAYLAFHNMNKPVGRFTTLEEKGGFMYYEAELDSIPYVKNTIKPQLKTKTLNQHSIGYDYIWDKTEYDEDQDALKLYEIDWYEGSLVTMGANENTPFLGFKAFLDKTDDYNLLATRADVLLRKIKNYPAEIELRQIISKYQSLSQSAADEITAMKKKPTKFDYDYMIKNFKL